MSVLTPVTEAGADSVGYTTTFAWIFGVDFLISYTVDIASFKPAELDGLAWLVATGAVTRRGVLLL